MKVECPNLEHKEKGMDKKNNKTKKAKRAYIAWEDNATSSNYSSKEDQKANVYLMARHQSTTSSVSLNISIKHENYSTLLHAFKETREEANILTMSNNRLKGLNNWMENKTNSLEEELKSVKNDFEHLEMIYKASSCNVVVSCKPTKCEHCEVLQEKK